MTILQTLRTRWGGGIRPSIKIDRDYDCIERWDGEGSGNGTCISFEAFGVTGALFIGRTPPRRDEPAKRAPRLEDWTAGLLLAAIIGAAIVWL